MNMRVTSTALPTSSGVITSGQSDNGIISPYELSTELHYIQDRLKKDLRDLRVLDPACGSGTRLSTLSTCGTHLLRGPEGFRES
jgi:hypothetical protein